ncbi:MAG: class I SAM-dependent methyltransferase [Sphingobium sp.]
MLATVPWERIRTFIEYGPGTGRFTQAALARLSADATLVALDTSEAFTRHLRHHIDDPRLRIVTGSAEDIRDILGRHGIFKADCILSGLPFSGISEDRAARIMEASAEILAPDGHFLAYQMRKTIADHIIRHFGVVEEAFAWWNMPPCHLYRARKPVVRAGYSSQEDGTNRRRA